MLALLGILMLALVVGKLARWMTPAVDLLLLLLVAAVVMIEYASWSAGNGASTGQQLRWLLALWR
jgi:hypothetical protein